MDPSLDALGIAPASVPTFREPEKHIFTHRAPLRYARA